MQSPVLAGIIGALRAWTVAVMVRAVARYSGGVLPTAALGCPSLARRSLAEAKLTRHAAKLEPCRASSTRERTPSLR
jgi:hypothetical protein